MTKAYARLEATRLFLQRVQLTLCGTGLLFIIPACYLGHDGAIKGASITVLAAIVLFVPLALITAAQVAMQATRSRSGSRPT